jgi:hypothetical protein
MRDKMTAMLFLSSQTIQQFVGEKRFSKQLEQTSAKHVYIEARLREQTRVRSLVNLEVLATSEHFSAAGKQTWKRLLSSVDADVVDKLVLGFEWTQLTAAVTPQADVVDAAGFRASAGAASTDVFYGDVRDQFVHR